MRLKDVRERRGKSIERKDKFYNPLEFVKAIKYFETNPRLASSKLEDYLKVYPHDKYAQCFYIDSLLCIRDFDRAKALIENFDIYDSKIMVDSDRLFHIKSKLNYIKAKLYSHQKEYEKAAETLSRDMYDKHCDIDKCVFYCKLRAGEDIASELDSYFYSQMRSYSEEYFRHHINKHIAKYRHDDIVVGSAFVDSFPVDEVIEELKRIIPSNMDKGFFSGIYDDTYFFKYDNCGRDDAKYTDYFQVVTIHDSINFITMMPCSLDGIENAIDLNYLKKDQSSHSLKRNSQIEKFNKRYGF